MEEIKIKPFALELIQEEFRHLDRMSSKQDDYIHKLWSELSVKDKLIVEVILRYYVKKLQKRKAKNEKLGRVESEEELNQKVFTKTLAKFFPTLEWLITFRFNCNHILNIQGTNRKPPKTKILLCNFDKVAIYDLIIALVVKGHHKASSQTSNKES